MIHQREITLHTRGHGDLHDITEHVAAIVSEAGVTAGLVNIFNIGSTGCVGTLEVEPGLTKDLPAVLDHLVPPGKDYGHETTWRDGNTHSHLQSTLVGPSLTLPIADGKLALGTWQQVFHLECDVKPRSRRLLVTIVAG
jgi:secondary thiamine-phosphate synthase enzyme